MKPEIKRTVTIDPEVVERLRLKLGLSESELAQRADLSRNVIRRIYGGNQCYLKTVRLLAAALKVEVGDLVLAPGGEDAKLDDYRLPATEEWEPKQYLGGWKKATNGLQLRVCRMAHRLVPTQCGRGKFYDLLELSTKEREAKRHYLLRHFEVSARVKDHRHVAENMSCAPVGDGKGWWVVDRWIEGDSLEIRLANGPIPRNELPRLMLGMAGGLAALHEAAVVYRELAPSRVILQHGAGDVVLTDFELAKLLDGAPSVANQWPDDPYRAPEVSDGEASVQADLYSLARVFLHAATGHLRGANEAQSELGRLKIPTFVSELLSACLEPAPSARPRSIDEVQKVLKAWP